MYAAIRNPTAMVETFHFKLRGFQREIGREIEREREGERERGGGLQELPAALRLKPLRPGGQCREKSWWRRPEE